MAVLHSLQTVVTLLILLGILVVAHEWGHFIFARLFGIRVDDFSIGFGKRLIRLGKRGDTEYNIRALPLGGFVKIAGMEADEAPLIQAKEKVLGKETADAADPDAGQIPLIAENTAAAEPYNAPDGFNSKPLWQRSLVILAGPVMSFLLGYLILCTMGWTVGLPMGQPLNKIGEVEPGGEGQRIGLRAGDEIEAINGQRITDGMQMVNLIHDSLGKPLTLTVRRGDEVMTKTATPQALTDDSGKPVQVVQVQTPGPLAPLGLKPGDTLSVVNTTEVTDRAGALSALHAYAGKPVALTVERDGAETTLHGTLPSAANLGAVKVEAHEIGVLRINPMAASQRTGFVASVRAGNALIGVMFRNLASLIRRGQLHKQVGGIIVMYRETGIAVENGLVQVVWLAAQLSISLAIFNLLPIPILDGGHLLTFFIEWVRGGRKMTEEWQQRFMLTGLMIIGALFLWIMTKNIWQLIAHQLPQ